MIGVALLGTRVLDHVLSVQGLMHGSCILGGLGWIQFMTCNFEREEICICEGEGLWLEFNHVVPPRHLDPELGMAALRPRPCDHPFQVKQSDYLLYGDFRRDYDVIVHALTRMRPLWLWLRPPAAFITILEGRS
jgi:hypothetical protein